MKKQHEWSSGMKIILSLEIAKSLRKIAKTWGNFLDFTNINWRVYEKFISMEKGINKRQVVLSL